MVRGDISITHGTTDWMDWNVIHRVLPVWGSGKERRGRPCMVRSESGLQPLTGLALRSSRLVIRLITAGSEGRACEARGV
jgi:hypothetical protein